MKALNNVSPYRKLSPEKRMMIYGWVVVNEDSVKQTAHDSEKRQDRLASDFAGDAA